MLSHEQMIERIEWPLLDCMQEYQFFYIPQRDDVAAYRFGFGRDLLSKRYRFHQLWIHDLELRATIFDQELLFHAPRYRPLFNVLSTSEFRFSTEARFAAALTWGGRSGKSLDEQIFALIAVGQPGNDRAAMRDLLQANALFAEAGVPRIQFLFLVAAGLEYVLPDGRTSFGDVDELEPAYADCHRIIETFQFNKTVWGPARMEGGNPVNDAKRVAQRCKTIVVRIPIDDA